MKVSMKASVPRPAGTVPTSFDVLPRFFKLSAQPSKIYFRGLHPPVSIALSNYTVVEIQCVRFPFDRL